MVALPTTAFAKVSLVIDPGHGGKDPGAMSGGVREKHTNLAISKEIAHEARRQGWKVHMTRTTDRFIPLTLRSRQANRTKADVLVSVHSNSTGEKALGNMTIYRGKKSKRLGDAIMSELAPMTNYADIGNRKDVRGLAVLRTSKRPTVIVEILSVTNRGERRQITDPTRQREYARAVVRGIAKFEGVKYKPVKNEKPNTAPKPQPVSTAPEPKPEVPQPQREYPASQPEPEAPVSAPGTSLPAETDEKTESSSAAPVEAESKRHDETRPAKKQVREESQMALFDLVQPLALTSPDSAFVAAKLNRSYASGADKPSKQEDESADRDVPVKFHGADAADEEEGI